MTVSASAQNALFQLDEDDPHFEEADVGGIQTLTADTVLNGVTYSAGTYVEPQYSYVIRPLGALDASLDFIGFAVSIGGPVVGLASE